MQFASIEELIKHVNQWIESVPNIERLNAGRNRIAYRHKDFVIKIPVSEKGLYDNGYEHRQWRRSLIELYDEKFAPCRILSNGALIMRMWNLLILI